MTRGQQIARDFREFHRENPHVYDELRTLALQLVRHGHRRVGMKQLFEVLRWQRALRTTGAFRLNNNFTAHYSRLLMEREPELRGVFEVRQSVADADRAGDVEFDPAGQGVAGVKRNAPKRRPEKIREWERRTRRKQREAASERRSQALAASDGDWRATNPPARKPGPQWRKDNPAVRAALRGFTQRVFALYGRRCICCRRRASQAHHVIPVRTILMREGIEAGAVLVGDARNGVPICDQCHERHEKAFRRIKRSELPPPAILWAHDNDWGWLVDKPDLYAAA